MPTKLNKAGNQQPYVPAGNGDASGEYGDNASGSNKHFTNFARPTETSNVEVKTNDVEEIKNQPKKEINIVETISNRFEKGTNQEIVDKLTNDVKESCDEEKIKKLDSYINKNVNFSVRYGGLKRGQAGCCWGNSIEMNSLDSDTFLHETGHSFDSFFSSELENNPNYKYTDKLVCKYIDEESGKCFNDIIHEELKMNPYYQDSINYGGYKIGKNDKKQIEPIIKNLTNIYDEFCSKEFDKITGVENSNQKLLELEKRKRNVLTDAEEQADKNVDKSDIGLKYKQARENVNKAEREYEQSQIGKGYVVYSNSPQVVEARKKRDDIYIEYRNQKDKLIDDYLKENWNEEDEKQYSNLRVKKYGLRKQIDGIDGIMGDIIDYAGVGHSKYSTNGHGSSYFNKRKIAGFSGEIFANMFDVYHLKDQTRWETIKKMIPNSAKMFEKMINKFTED